MSDLAVVILAKNEALHIERCVTWIQPLEPKQIFVVDCFSTDGTQEIATRCGATVVEREWPGFYAKQFNWALENLPIEATWVLRLDADEYLTDETIARLKQNLENMPAEVDGLTLRLDRRFLGREIHYGVPTLRLLRIFRNGRGRLEDRAMDEHVIVGEFNQVDGQWELKSEGVTIDFDGAFCDDNLNSFAWWREKHIGYAEREAQDAIALFASPERLTHPSATDQKKMKYYKLPPYVRAVMYWGIRYFLWKGFLDGRAGWQWNFWQGLWYRWTVDKRIQEMKRERRRRS